jgi:hypothetical protein
MADFFKANTSKPTVVVATPVPGSSVNDPVIVQASAVPSTGHSITGWHIYVDNSDVFSGGAVTSIDATLNLKTTAHTVVVRAWDNSGAYGDQTFSITVR